MSSAPEFLDTAEGFEGFVGAWETGRLPKAQWTHAAHVAVSAYLTLTYGREEGLARMRSGVIRHNEAVGTPNTDSGGYHETLTRFWMAAIAEFLDTLPSRGSEGAGHEAVRAAVAAFGEDRDLPRRHYSFDVVRDVRARREWVAPDR